MTGRNRTIGLVSVCQVTGANKIEKGDIMPTIKERIQGLDNFQVVRFFRHFSRQLVGGATVSVNQIKNGIPDATRALEGFEQIENLTPDQAERSLEPSVSAAMARNILVHLADDAEFCPPIERALDTYRDDELVADVILAVGLVASVLLIAATIEFEGEVAGIKFKKGKADSEIVKAITEPFAKALSTIIKP